MENSNFIAFIKFKKIRFNKIFFPTVLTYKNATQKTEKNSGTLSFEIQNINWQNKISKIENWESKPEKMIVKFLFSIPKSLESNTHYFLSIYIRYNWITIITIILISKNFDAKCDVLFDGLAYLQKIEFLKKWTMTKFMMDIHLMTLQSYSW